MPSTSVFLTGATGYAGQPVLAELLRRNCTVTALARRQIDLDGCRSVIAELAKLNTLTAEIARTEAIIHLASSRSYERDSVLSDDILGTSLLIDAWRRGPFVYVSSPTIHGIPVGTLTEDSPIDLMYWYDIGKFCNEFQLRLASASAGRGSAITLRPGIIFASNDRGHDRQFLAELVSQCQRGARFVFDSEKGLETYGASFIGGADFGRAVADALSIEVSGPYNVAGGFCAWKELIETINRLAGTGGEFVIRPGARPEGDEIRLPQSRTFLDTSAFAARIGFVPRQSLEELVEEFVRAERNARPA